MATKTGHIFRAVLRVILQSISAIFHGKFLLGLNIGRYFIHIIYCFVLIGIAIWISLGIDDTMTRVERKNKIIEQQEEVITMKRYKLYSVTRRSEVELRLKEMGSKVKDAEKPAYIVR